MQKREKLQSTFSHEASSSLSIQCSLSLFEENVIPSILPAANSTGSFTEGSFAITLREEPKIFLYHVAPSSSSLSNTRTVILDFCQENNISMGDITAIAADVTYVNTGSKGEVINRLELHLRHPVQRFIYMFNFNELLMRHLFMHLSGTTVFASN